MTAQLDFWPDETGGTRLHWSLSRDRRLRDCARKYYLFHYGAKGGASADPKSQARAAYVLRALRTRHMWVGEVVHEMIELALSAARRNESFTVDALIERGTRRMRAQYAESLQRVYWERPETACGLVEHEYKEDVTKEDWQAARNRMERCLRGFFALPLFAEIRAMPAWRYLALESLGSFELDGATIAVKPDLAWREPSGHVIIADWKTGRAREEDERLQLAIYGAYARRNWGAHDGLTGVVAHLDPNEDEPSVSRYQITPHDLDAAEHLIRSSVTQMRALHEDPAVVPEPERFPMTSDEVRCARCAFRRLCRRG